MDREETLMGEPHHTSQSPRRQGHPRVLLMVLISSGGRVPWPGEDACYCACYCVQTAGSPLGIAHGIAGGPRALGVGGKKFPELPRELQGCLCVKA